MKIGCENAIHNFPQNISGIQVWQEGDFTKPTKSNQKSTVYSSEMRHVTIQYIP